MSDKPFTVAIIWKSGSLSGAERRMLSIAKSLNDSGQRAIVVLEEHNAHALQKLIGELPPYVRSFHVPFVLRAISHAKGRLRILWWWSGLRYIYHSSMKQKLRKLQKIENIGVWHISLGAELTRCTTGPTLFEVTSPDIADQLVCSYPEIIPEEVLMHAVSPSVAASLRKRFNNRRIIEAPILFPSIDPIESRKPEIEKKEKRIVFAHRLIPRKNGQLFAKVARRFLAVHPDWRVAIRGKGPDESKMREELNAEILEGKVEFGYVTDIQADLYRSSIFVSIISPDNYPSQSIVEAMIAGNALLLSETGQSCEMFLDGNGDSSPLDEDSVVACLKSLVSDAEKLNAMCRRSNEIASEKFSQARYLQHLMHVYDMCRSDTT